MARIFACVATIATSLLSAIGSADEPGPILVVPASDVLMNVTSDVPQQVSLDSGVAWRLVDANDPNHHFRAQLLTAVLPDGTPDKQSRRMVVAIPAGKKPNATRRFRVVPDTVKSPNTGESKEETFRFKESSTKSLGLWEKNQPVLVYNHGTITDPQVPENDPRRSRGCYIHPLWGLYGEVLTDDFPRDHYHHHGIFWAWPSVGYDGREYSLWNYRDIEPKFVRWLARETGPVAAQLGVENGWYVGDKKIMIERVWLLTHRSSDGERARDLQFTWIPFDKPITLSGQPTKSYGGLTMRFDISPRKNGMITTPQGAAKREGGVFTTKSDLVNTRLPWADMTSHFPQAPERSGAALFVPTSHPNYPPSWLTRSYGCVCIGWPGTEGRTFKVGEPIRLNYRVWIHKHAVGVDRLQKSYQGYTTLDDVKWEF